MATFPVFAVFTVLRRATNFAIMNPAMEVLFTVVRREDKYKAKNVIETFVYRGGDQLSGWAYAGLAALGLTLSGISFVAVPLSVFWLGLGLWLGRRQAQMAVGIAGSVRDARRSKTRPHSFLNLHVEYLKSHEHSDHSAAAGRRARRVLRPVHLAGP